MKRQINVLYLINALLYLGGAERVVANTVALVDRRRYRPTVCTLLPRGSLEAEIEKYGVRVVSLGARSKLDLTIIPKLFRLLKQEKIDILHSFLFHANIVGRIVGRLAGVPIMLSSERIIEIEGKNRLLLNRLTAPLADKIIVVSDAVKEFAIRKIGISPSKLVTIYNGVDLSKYSEKAAAPGVEARKRALDIDLSHRVVGTVGNLEARKGYEYLLQAASLVLTENRERGITFLLVGEGSQRVKLENLAKDLGISSSVIFAGYRDDIPQVLSAMDVFVLASIYEGLPNALLEAMAMGKPVVATRVAGIPDVVADGEMGILVHRRNPHALASAIRTLLVDEERAQEMGYMGRKRVEDAFTVETMVAKTEELYEELIEEKLGGT